MIQHSQSVSWALSTLYLSKLILNHALIRGSSKKNFRSPRTEINRIFILNSANSLSIQGISFYLLIYRGAPKKTKRLRPQSVDD